jgi:putative NIF3 family GTP cyclohydrolase 1 type 2
MTPRELVARIKAQAAAEGVGEPARPSRRDTFKFGDPDVQITGVATTGMSTWDVLKRAKAQSRNLVITHEATFFRDDDVTDFLTNDPLYAAKVAFLKESGLVIWRNHDLSHRMHPDQIFAEQLKTLGWKADTDRPARRMPVVTLEQPMTLAELAAYVHARTGVKSYRVTGRPDMRVRRVAIGVGYAFPSFVAEPDVDVIVGGESAEGSESIAPTYDATAYAEDATLLGQPRGIILLGHMGTEDIGMKLVAEWIKSFVPELDIAYLPAGEPFGPPLSDRRT